MIRTDSKTGEFLDVNQVHKGDARILLKKVQPNSIKLSVWSPPYHVGKEYEKGMSYEDWVSLLREVIKEHYEILVPGGFLVINIADILCFKDKSMPRIQALNLNRQRSQVTKTDILKAMSNHPDFNRDQLALLLGCSEQTIDRRLHGNNIRGGKYSDQTRVKVVGGLIESFALEAGLYPYDRRIWVKDPAWANSKFSTLSYRSVDEFEYLYFFWKPGVTEIKRERLTNDEWADWGYRGVWKIPSVRSNYDHEAKFPEELPSRVIRLLTDPGDIVLDCFMGSGTTAIAALKNNRQYVGIELFAKYVALSNKNIKDAIKKRDQSLKQSRLAKSWN